MCKSCHLAYELIIAFPRGSKYPIFKDSGPRNHLGCGFLGAETLNIGYLDPLSLMQNNSQASFVDFLEA